MRLLPIVGYLILAFAVAGAFAHTENERKHRVAALNFVNTAQCKEIEALKYQFRIDAIEDYNRLEETLRLLKLERTPEIEERARRDKDTVLKRFQQGTCPRKLIE